MPRYVPGLKLEFGQIGTHSWTAAPADLMEDVVQVVVEESLHLPTMFAILVSNPSFPATMSDRTWQHADLFQFGKGVRIGFAASTTEAQEFNDEKIAYLVEGEITAIESHFNPDSQAPMVIRGYDISHRLHRGRHNRSFQNMKDCDIVRKIIQEVGILPGTIEDNQGPYGYNDISGMNGYVFQKNQTNMEFLQERAARNGFELFVEGSALQFRKPAAGDALSLKWLEDLTSFRVRMNSAEQISAVEVRSWDYSQKQVISATRSQSQQITANQHGNGSRTSTSFNGQPRDPRVIVVDQPVYAAQEAETMAQALLDELGGEFTYADARANGNPELRPRKVVQLTHMGDYSGSYYVTETRHIYQKGYFTEFSVRGLRGGDLFTAIAPSQPRLQPGQSLMVGIVTDNKDPNGWGRVRVKFPTLADDHNSYWARMVQMGAGANRGFDCLPEINDEVLVAFEHGDIHRPYIIGGVWNGKDVPPERVQNSIGQDSTVRLRTFKTRTGHRLQFVEEDQGAVSRAGTYMATAKGHQMQLNDSEQAIALETTGRHHLRLDDRQHRLELRSTQGHMLVMQDGLRDLRLQSTGTLSITAPTRLTLSVGTSMIELTPAGITLRSGGAITIEAANATLRGAAATTIQGATVAVQGGIIRLN